MKPKYKKYKIQQGDTLESIAKKLDKSSHEVKSFHNIFCETEEYIGIEFPRNLVELFIYPTYNQEELSLIPKVPFERPYHLAMKPAQVSNNFGVMYTILSGKEENTLKFECSVAFKRLTSEGDFIFEINRISKTFINDEETSTIADELAEKTNAVLYPLEVVVNDEGNWTGISNYKAIKTRWKKVKKKILDEYEGEWVEQYLLLNEETLEEEASLVNSLKKDWFLKSYFNTIYIYYTNKLHIETHALFPLLTNCDALVYNVEQKINEFLDDYNLIRIEQNGILADERSKTDLENEMNIPYYGTLYPGEDIADGKFRSLYFLNSKTNGIESLFLECSVKTNEEKKVQVVVSLL
ncbi:hypothetical protein ACFSX9_05790 [Flavobacterium ardleyense]|uniref:LysM domain-containing protein n=1 Tax=Flavobacterium ardleyense TaxID=2038737 RepID=A0ABW5Z664_9FLAO